MDDGHILSFATIALGIVLLIVLSIGGVLLHLFFKDIHDKEREKDLEESNQKKN
jgi:hypothetical protein